jgi:hypothetical protein
MGWVVSIKTISLMVMTTTARPISVAANVPVMQKSP